ncbi:hypothetical protein RQP46_002871 [Phenoliferia psychrophenolica]
MTDSPTAACFSLPFEVWDQILLDPAIEFPDLLRLGATCTDLRSLVASPILDGKRRRLAWSPTSRPITAATQITLHPILATPSFHLQLPSLCSILSLYSSTAAQHSVLSERITDPPLPELWVCLLSHSLHVVSSTGEGVTLGEALEKLREFWEEDVPITFEGFTGAARRARKERRKNKEPEREGFTWYESLEVGRKDIQRTSARWVTAAVDSMGNARLVVERFQT